MKNNLLSCKLLQVSWNALLFSQDQILHLIYPLELSMATKQPKVENILHVNKVIKKVKNIMRKLIQFSNLWDFKYWKIKAFGDISYAYLPDQYSSASSRIILTHGENGKQYPIPWCSNYKRHNCCWLIMSSWHSSSCILH